MLVVSPAKAVEVEFIPLSAAAPWNTRTYRAGMSSATAQAVDLELLARRGGTNASLLQSFALPLPFE